ncbi:MAG: TolC family protein [Candidatus Solibacter usitatus]|nr:TolC family protein [Candidatus Solibacter usitatus]
MCCWALAGQNAGLTIDEAVKEAIEKNLGLLAERYSVSIAEARIITAKLRPNPVFSYGQDYQDWLGTGFNSINAAGPAEFSLRTDFLLERGRKRERRIEVAETARAVAQLQLLNSTRTLVLDVQSAFVDVLLAKDNLALARDNLKSFESIVEINSTRVRAGDLAKVELVRSQVAALQYRNAVLQAESRLRVARNRLQTLIGRTSFLPDFDAVGDLRRDAARLPVDNVLSAALELRPDLQALGKDQARSLADIRLQIAQGKVDYTVGAQFHRQYNNATGSSLGLFFSAPIPVFNRNQGEIERARREQQQIQARIRALQNDIRTEVHNAYQQYSTARNLVESIERDMLQQAGEVRETINYSYRRGEASFVELLDAQRAFNDTRQAYNEARAEFARSLYALDAISGKGVTP